MVGTVTLDHRQLSAIADGLAYANIHTTDNGGGLMRGQLRRAEVTYLMGVMSPKKEVPVIDSTASGIGSRCCASAYTGRHFYFYQRISDAHKRHYCYLYRCRW